MRVVFMGSAAASAECLRALLRDDLFEIVGVVTQPDRPVGRGKALAPCPLAKFAAERGLGDRIIKPERVNDEEPMAQLRAWRPDVIAVVAFGQILKKPLLDLPPHGCVNCHFSLLPKYRGAAPVIAALEAGEKMTGVTVMHMGEGLDDGPIMLQGFEPIYPDTTGGMLMDDLSVAGGVTLAKALRLLAEGRLPPEIPQDGQFATYVKKLKKTDGLVNWDWPAIEIERRVRAYDPWPGCYTFLPPRLRRRGSQGRVVIGRAKIMRLEGEAERAAAPGTVLRCLTQRVKGVEDQVLGPVVKCHDTALALTWLKPEGGSFMRGDDFLRGRPLEPGADRFVTDVGPMGD